ncbi:pyruvate carboxylase [Neolewinella lacunae]|uniref:Pyruvate carboxylase n=1 Tax=Neolewinella lacunae TaxID=1517758 RepID=A0A923PJG9_9BACT|nr:pyruvate carboxylase [Neolewinella lacunae]MBC6995205.1 pyruvate carboxylase [Neolewinella lacunae]MDN3635486.1 pyruvate carboxylase [Neolewinella lacunae]
MTTPKITRFRKILVANRGEIAIRILRAASELKLRTVAIYTYEDRYSLHRYKADESYQIGPDDEPLRPYIDIKAIIKLAQEQKVDAIHPGYGFLSENVEFARACRDAGIAFVGPSPESMDQLGDKVAAKELARRVNVPLIRDSNKDISDPNVAAAEAADIGYPVIIKAASGGGGRGMRVVRNEKDLRNEVVDAASEAEKAFGDGTIFLEKFIENPRHIEVQLLGDHYGNLVHLHERDCSVQRRFQKVVEVAPAANLSQEVKDQLFDYALRLGREVGYYCAGTVEFLVDADDSVYFIEVNPRIQVEHTITEEVTGIDLVRTQFLVTMGYPLSHPTIFIKDQDSVKVNGFAIQCRVTTEDPGNNFKPDYGTLIAYRSASGMGIRLDAGSAFPGAVISPYFDSLLVKVTGTGRTLQGAADRLHRALREFRVRGVKTNIGFLLNLLENEDFQRGKATVRFIPDHPELMKAHNFRDRGTKLLSYLADVIVNGNPDVKNPDPTRTFLKPVVPTFDPFAEVPKGSRDLLLEKGRDGFIDWLKAEKKIHYTDTTFRDAHQSLLATRMRMVDMLNVARSYAINQPADLFSMEVWGGATFDVALRFLKADPWRRLRKLRTAMPNTLFQMLLRGSNAVGYKAYPDNLIIKFIEEAATGFPTHDRDGQVTGMTGGIDLFRIFDSLNWVKNMEVSIKTVRENTKSLAEACICYSGDITDPKKTKFDLNYYVTLAKQLESAGAHLLCIKDMAGLLKPLAATELIQALKDATSLPIHLHTHDTSGIQSATYLRAIEAGVDIVDVAINSLSGLTSQPGYNSIAAMLQGHPRENPVNLPLLNQYADYWETVRTFYYPFETELRAGTATIYDTEIPGGQYSNLRPQARGLGLEERFPTIRQNYAAANELFGNLIKVTPSSKVVGDMAMFMTSNDLTADDVRQRGQKLDFPDSVKDLMRGDLGQIEGGFDPEVQKLVLKDEKPYTDRPNAHLEPIDWAAAREDYEKQFGVAPPDDKALLSYLLYPKVYAEYFAFEEEFGQVANLPTPAFFYGLKPNEEVLVRLSAGKTITVKYLNMTEADGHGNRLVFFSLNGQTRSITVRDRSKSTKLVAHQKAAGPGQVGSPLMGNLSRILVKVGDKVSAGDPLFVIEAMKMESTITSPSDGEVLGIALKEKTLVEANDLVVTVG